MSETSQQAKSTQTKGSTQQKQKTQTKSTQDKAKVAGQGSLASAIQAMPRTITKDARNAFGKYDYASADAVYKEVMPHLTARGLAIWQQERSFEIIEVKEMKTNKQTGEKVDVVTRSYIKATYEFAVTPDGRAPEPGQVELFTIRHQVTGTQSYGAVRTYAQKYWIRGKFALATGEEGDDEGQSKPFEDTVPASANKKTGKWSLDLETLEYKLTGEFSEKIESQRALMRLIQADFGSEADPQKALKIFEVNKKLISKEIPDEGKTKAGRQAIRDMIKDLQARAEGSQQAEEAKTGEGRWVFDEKNGEFNSEGVWESDEIREKALVVALNRVFVEGAEKDHVNKVFLANERNILSINEEDREKIYEKVDSLTLPPATTDGSEAQEGSEAQDGDAF